VSSDLAESVQVVIVFVLFEVFVLFVEQLLRGGQLDWQCADPSYGVRRCASKEVQHARFLPYTGSP
jgi:hypothetical protein